jgi:hypothetical protein
MIADSITITAPTFRTLPQDTQDIILAAVFGYQISHLPNPASIPSSSLLDQDDDDLAQLSPSQAREFYSGCGEKTRKALETIAKSDSNKFHLADVAKAVGVEPAELRGVWGGLTRRLNTITGGDDGHLINWEGPGVFDDEGNYLDHIGEVSELTYQSFRKLLVK